MAFPPEIFHVIVDFTHTKNPKFSKISKMPYFKKFSSASNVPFDFPYDKTSIPNLSIIPYNLRTITQRFDTKI
jgi:hypothetical protein